MAQRYRNAALATLDTLSSPAYLAQGTASPGILLHGVGFHPNQQKPAGSDVDRSVIHADYYFISVWVIPPGASEVLLAERSAFRTGTPLTDDLGKVSLRSIGADGDIQVTGHTVRAVTSLAYEEVHDPGPPTQEALGVAISEEESLRGCAAAPGSALAAADVLRAWLRVGRRRRRQ